MQVILKKEVQNLGEVGDVVNVKDGYARNFLLANGSAEIATPGALANREKNMARIQAKQEKLHQEALAKAEEIKKFGKLELSAKAGESGKLFGTITTKKLTEELSAKAGIEVDKKSVSLNAPINKIGDYTMLIKLTSKVKCELAISVTASEVVKESIVEEVEAKEAEEAKEEAAE
jgi:large subunit ribosomal protein L9